MYYNNNDIRIEEMPMPEIEPGEILVKIEASGICGSDVMEWYRVHKAPLVLGHEIAGTIVEVGEGVEKYKVGERVSVSHHVPCNTCYYCVTGHQTSCDTLRTTKFYPGGFSEFVRIPAINVDRGVYPFPEDLPFEEATFTEPLACVLRGQRRAGLEAGQSLVVVGSGISGVLHIALARAMSARCIVATDISPFRIEMAERYGADCSIHADQDVPMFLREVNGGRLADVVIVCAGSEAAITNAFQLVERGGTILLFAPTNPGVTLPLPFNDIFWGNDITLTTTYAGDRTDHLTALELIKTGRVKVKEMITHRLPLEDTDRGFQLVASANQSIKVIVEPQR
jgi:L-iditol 2-dehydrogenase